MEKSESSTRLRHSEGTDRISSLPEALHSRILSLLPTKNAVATSILSKRWKFVWTSITDLSFDDGRIYNLRLRSGEALITRRQKFTQFVNSVLVLLNSPFIQNFHLRGHYEHCDPFYLQLWICAAIRRTIQKLELHLDLDKPMELPLSHFNCKTLTLLKLYADSNFNVVASGSVCFPNLQTLELFNLKFTITSDCSVQFPSLKVLKLWYVEYANEESVHKLFASCPVLDSLNLQIRYSDIGPRFIISIPSLRSLEICTLCNEQKIPIEQPLPTEHHACNKYKLHIDTPALEYLLLCDHSFFEVTIENLPSLLKADVKFELDHVSDIRKRTRENIIAVLFNVWFLSISGNALKGIDSISENIAPVFSNLTRLEIYKYVCRDLSFAITNLLEMTNNLEHLIMRGFYSCCNPRESSWKEPLSVPMCLKRRITTISFIFIPDCGHELGLIRYFLKNAEVLEMLKIGFCSTLGQFQAMEISKYPRASSACQLKF